MLRTLGRSLVSTILVRVLSLFVALAVTGCGWQPTPTPRSTTPDGGDTTAPDDAATGVGSDPVDQTPSGDASTDEPAEPDDIDPGVAPQADDGTDDDTTSNDDVPSNGHCEAVADWDSTWAAFENEVLELANGRRAAGAECGSAGTFGPTEPLTMNAALRCAARSHSMDMGTRGYFDHYTPEELGPGERLDEAGYSGSSWAENIAWGYATPEAVVSGWMSSPGHCANIMQAGFTETGIGYYEGSLWTQTFGQP